MSRWLAGAAVGGGALVPGKLDGCPGVASGHEVGVLARAGVHRACPHSYQGGKILVAISPLASSRLQEASLVKV